MRDELMDRHATENLATHLGLICPAEPRWKTSRLFSYGTFLLKLDGWNLSQSRYRPATNSTHIDFNGYQPLLLATPNGASTLAGWCKANGFPRQLLAVWMLHSREERSIWLAVGLLHLVHPWAGRVHVQRLGRLPLNQTCSGGSVTRTHLRAATSWNTMKCITGDTVPHSDRLHHATSWTNNVPPQQNVIVSSWGHFALSVTAGYKLLTKLHSLNSR